jgi:hypothetical protein
MGGRKREIGREDGVLAFHFVEVFNLYGGADFCLENRVAEVWR